MNVKLTLSDVQRYLAWLGLYTGKVDGITGPKTQTALSEFQEFEGITNEPVKHLYNKVSNFYVNDWSDKYGLAYAVQDLCAHMYRPNTDFAAYIMATIQHETNGTFKPVEEAYYIKNKARRERIQRNFRYFPFFGRGYVQLTWDYNYKKYANILGIDIVKDPTIAQDKFISLFITVHGMITGSFTARDLDRYCTNGALDPIQARRTVNGVRKGKVLPDKAELIATYFVQWKRFYATNT
jgi:hypothetical protein